MSKLGQFSMIAMNHAEFPNPYVGKQNVKKHILEVEISQLSKDLMSWMDTNPRSQNVKSHVSVGIRETLANPEEMLHLLSNGMLFAAKSASYDESTHLFTMKFSDPKIHGNIDGGHLLKNCLDSLISSNPHILHYITLTVIEGITDRDMLVRLAKTRNTSISVSERSICNFNGDFDEAKALINTVSYASGRKLSDFMNYYQSGVDKNKIKIEKVLGLLMIFNSYYSPEKKLTMYRNLARQGKETLPLYLRDSFIRDGLFEDYQFRGDKICRTTAMATIFKDILDLYDYIEYSLASGEFITPEVYQRYLSVFENKRIVKKPHTTFSAIQLERSTSPLLVFMLTCAFCQYVEPEQDPLKQLKWRTDLPSVTAAWEKVGSNLVDRVVSLCKNRNYLLDVRDSLPEWENLQKIALKV